MSKSKFHNYVLLCIAEKSYLLFEGSTYRTYENFCSNFKNYLEDTNRSITSKFNSFVMLIIVELKLIFGFKANESLQYLIHYFSFENHTVFEEYITKMRRVNPFYCQP
jgi:hypothetical protein